MFDVKDVICDWSPCKIFY